MAVTMGQGIIDTGDAGRGAGTSLAMREYGGRGVLRPPVLKSHRQKSRVKGHFRLMPWGKDT